MPIFIPILIGATLAGIAGVGGKKGYDGVGAFKRAKALGEKAQARHERHVVLLESAREHLKDRIDALQQQRVAVVERTLQRMVDLLAALQRKGRLRSTALFERAGVEPERVPGFVAECFEASGVATGGLAAIGAGAGASVAATSLVTTLATASTGTAISALSGAAAEGAMLAWFGGGALAAGGWGVAAGALVLNGIAVAPAIGVGGFVLAAKGEKALTKAKAYSATVGKAVAKIDALIDFHHRAELRIDEIVDVLARLEARAAAALSNVESLADTFDEDDDDHVNRLAAALLTCRAASELVHVRVLDDNGQLDRSSQITLDRLRGALHFTAPSKRAEDGHGVAEAGVADDVRPPGRTRGKGAGKRRSDRKNRGGSKGRRGRSA